MPILRGLTKNITNEFLDKLQKKLDILIRWTTKHGFLVTFASGNNDCIEDNCTDTKKILNLQLHIVKESFDINGSLLPSIKKIMTDKSMSDDLRHRVEQLWNEFVGCLERFQRDARRLLFMHEAFSDISSPGSLLSWRGIKSGLHTPSSKYDRADVNTTKTKLMSKPPAGEKAVGQLIEERITKLSQILLALQNQSAVYAWSVENYTSIGVSMNSHMVPPESVGPRFSIQALCQSWKIIIPLILATLFVVLLLLILGWVFGYF